MLLIALVATGPSIAAQRARGLAGGMAGPQASIPCSQRWQKVFPGLQYRTANLEAMESADLDDDGDPDLVTVGAGLTIFPNDGRGNFSAQDYATAPSTDLAFLDITGDGDLDLALVGWSVPQLTLLENQGNGTFAPAGTIAMAHALRLTAMEIGTDGRTDLAVGHSSVNSVTVLENLGGGAFDVFQTFQTMAAVRDLEHLDREGDGLQDLVVAAANGVWVYKNFGNRFAFPYGIGVDNPQKLLVLNIDGDADEDIVVASRSGTYTIRNDGESGLTALLSYGGSTPYGLASLDLEPDGDLDVAWTELRYDLLGSVRLFTNDGAGTFTNAGTHVATYRGSIAAGDWNGDGRSDVAALGHNEGLLSLLFNRGTGITPEPSFPAGGNILQSMDHADLDGDGDRDLAALRNHPDFISFAVLFNDGDAAFAAPLSQSESGSEVADIQCADLDGDGATDLVFRSDAALQVYENRGTFVAGARPPVASAGTRLVVLDLDGDGDLDLAANTSQSLSLVENLGAATFAPHVPHPIGIDTPVLQGADLDQDGDQDLVAADDNLILLENLGGGAFAPTTLATAGVATASLVCADLDHDGDIDLGHSTSSFTPNLQVFENLGGGALALSVDQSLPIYVSDLQVADLDRDGWVDLAGMSRYLNSLTFFHGSGALAPLPYAHHLAGPIPVDFLSADLDGDGDAELVSADYQAGRVTILHNRCD